MRKAGTGDAYRVHQMWRRVHRPEEYVDELSRHLAADVRVPYSLIKPLVPAVRRMVSRWEHAAVETTEYFECEKRGRLLRTVFLITDYSDHLVYGVLDKLHRGLLAGRVRKLRGNEDFQWDLLGGVLVDFGRRAGIGNGTIGELLNFRHANSDFHTMTTWFMDRVEIANFRTGKIESLHLPEKEITRIVDYSVGFQREICGKKSRVVLPEEPAWDEFYALMADYEKMKAGGAG
ncbi:MAG: hypothetical protein AB1742_03135 [bacterium]